MKPGPLGKGLLDASDPLGAPPAPAGGGGDETRTDVSPHVQAIIDAVNTDDASALDTSLKAYVKACLAEGEDE